MSVLRYLLAHWAGASAGLVVLLTGIVVLQNLEPVQFDLLFWSIAELPKLVLVLASMALGAVLAEVARLLLRTRSRARASALRPPD
jgi:uncharacterized integral membrane protein